MKIAMIGTGYVGLVSGVCFSDFGHEVICVDKYLKKIELLEAGEVPIYEPGLDVAMARNVAAGRLRFISDLAAAVAGAEAIFVAVGTPTRRDGAHGAQWPHGRPADHGWDGRAGSDPVCDRHCRHSGPASL